MCLYSKNRFPRIAWKPIKVYKIVYFKDGIYYTPYCFYKLRHKNLINIFNTLLSVIVMIKKSRSHGYSDFYEVNSGFFHSFYDKTMALDKLNNMPRYYWILKLLVANKIIFLIECTIPRFSLYYIGTEGEICSNRLNTEFKKYETDN